jgi:hypothetical protein
MRTASGEYQFYDNSGYHPETGEPLSIITKEVIEAWRCCFWRDDRWKPSRL